MEKYIKLVEEVRTFWSNVLENNGGQLGDRGVTVWVDKNDERVDSIYTPEGSTHNWIIDNATGETLFAIDKDGVQLDIEKLN